jgi:fumarate reductase subunit C
MSRRPWREPQRWHWWLHNAPYRRYMLREATALPLFLYALLLVQGLYRFTQGPDSFTRWLEGLQAPGWLLFHGLALAAAVFHAVTWIALVPKILVIHTARLQVSGTAIRRLHQGAAIAGSVLLVALAYGAWVPGGGL